MKKIVMNSREKKKYRGTLILAIGITLMGILCFYVRYIDSLVPNNVMIIKDRAEKLDFAVPFECDIQNAVGAMSVSNSKKNTHNLHFSMNNTVTLQASDTGSYQAKLKLFGLFHYKNMQINVIDEQKVMPSGRAVGLYINSNGLMVLGTSAVQGQDGFEHEPAANIIQTGDYIYKIAGKKVRDIDDVVDILQKCGEGKVKIHLKRGNNVLDANVENVLANDGQYKIGVWLREDTEGIGTLTYLTKNNQYAALGHGITDIDTDLLIDIKEGGVYPASVEQVVRGETGMPGEILGSVKLGDSAKIGSIDSNTKYGISGDIFDKAYRYDEKKALPIAVKQDAKEGEAMIRCQLSDKVREYKIRIEKIELNADENKSMVIKVTDKELLKAAGGIVQGMSGSPIIQNGRIIGAVTHVFVNDSTRGYGIFVEDMLE